MLRILFLVNIFLCPLVVSKRRHKESSEGDLGGHLVSALRNDVNLDLPEDEEYEDLRAELFAYHTALASITSSRRSMKTTPCWKLGGICVDHKLCEGHRFMTQVPGCKKNLEVCCFTWNNFNVRDMKDKGLGVLAMPWSLQTEFGGKGIIGPYSSENKKQDHPNIKHDLDSLDYDDKKVIHGAHEDSLHHDDKKNIHGAHEDSLHHDDKKNIHGAHQDSLYESYEKHPLMVYEAHPHHKNKNFNLDFWPHYSHNKFIAKYPKLKNKYKKKRMIYIKDGETKPIILSVKK